MSDTETKEVTLEWVETIENGATLWYANLDSWVHSPPWPWTTVGVTHDLVAFSLDFTDNEFTYFTEVGLFETVERARTAAERILAAMSSSPSVVLRDDLNRLVTVSVDLRVGATVAVAVRPEPLPDRGGESLETDTRAS